VGERAAIALVQLLAAFDGIRDAQIGLLVRVELARKVAREPETSPTSNT
jgi:hypothetical protein